MVISVDKKYEELVLDRMAEYSSNKELIVYIASWNVGGVRVDKLPDLSSWLLNSSNNP